MKQVKLEPTIDTMLTELSKNRKKNGHLNKSKQGIVAELIMGLHKREIK
jgi:hypothetical protein